MSTGDSSTLGVTTGDLGRLANDLRTSASAVSGQVKTISDNLFGPGEAGAAYSSQGGAIQTGLEALRQRIDDWSTASGATADVIGAASVEYSTVDKERAAALANK